MSLSRASSPTVNLIARSLSDFLIRFRCSINPCQASSGIQSGKTKLGACALLFLSSMCIGLVRLGSEGSEGGLCGSRNL